MGWTKSAYEGHEAIVGETDHLRLVILPGLGSKMISLTDKRSGREWLYRKDRPLGNAGYDSSFTIGDLSGWDEMFPGIDRCRYPEFPWKDTPVPDHGEVWSIPWDTVIRDQVLTCSVHGVRFPYTFSKIISFPDTQTFRMEYRVTNHSPFPFSFAWAAHPLFRAEPGMRLEVPEDMNEIMMTYSEKERLGVFGDVHSWPIPGRPYSGGRLDVAAPADSEIAEKYFFTRPVTEGRVSLTEPNSGARLTMTFPPEKVPYLAIWANFGGFEGDCNWAIEPITGFGDALDYAMGEKKTAVVQPGEDYTWHLEIRIT